MDLIDTHSHIYLPDFDEDRPLMMERAENEGIRTILMPAIDAGTHEQMIALEQESNGKHLSMMGLHPCSVRDNYERELDNVRKYLEERKFVAIGEIGLDFYWDLSFKEQQVEAFQKQISWALELDLPIVIHSRNSIDECIRVVEENQDGRLRGVFHCFSGNIDQAKKIMGLGFFLGIGGVITFKNGGLDKVMADLPLHQVVLETDAPYLAPVPFRGKRNEPSYLKYVVQKLADIKKMHPEEIAQLTTENSIALFRLD